MNEEELKKHIISLLEKRDLISLTNDCYNPYFDNEDRKKYIKELEQKYNCDIDYISYNITFNK